MFIVEIEEGVWLAPWKGDPGRTLVRESAQKYKTKAAAKGALTKVIFRHRGGFPNAKIEEM